MSIQEATRYCLKNLSNFEGRARRAEFWWYYLALYIAHTAVSLVLWVVALAIVFLVAGASFSVETSDAIEAGQATAMFVILVLAYALTWLVGLASIGMQLSAMVRRLHDVGQSGHLMWLYFAGLGIVPLIMCIQDGQPYANRFGPDPKAAERMVLTQPVAPSQ